MKKFLHGLSGALLMLFAFAFGGVLFLSRFISPLSDQLFEYFPVYGSAAGGIFLILCLVYAGTFGKRTPRVKFISFSSEDGDVCISVNAVRDFIRKIADEFTLVSRMEPSIRSEKELISIDLDVKVQTGSRIPELSQMLQSRVRESIRDGLGIEEVSEIKVRIQEIVGAPPASSVE